MLDMYILKGKKPIKEPDLMKWAKWFEKSERFVAKTEIKGITISTIFLGLDHNYFGNEVPILFETMVFGGELDQEEERYSTWDEAVKGHDEMVKRVSNKKESKGT